MTESGMDPGIPRGVSGRRRGRSHPSGIRAPRGKPRGLTGRGLVILYTGDGKGKTTAALGLALRAVGNGMRVFMVQFIKGPWPTGERRLAGLRDQLEIRAMGKGFVGILGDKLPFGDHVEAARQALEEGKAQLASGNYDMVILDEAITALQLGLLAEAEVLGVIKDRPKLVHLVLTGRGATPAVIEMADIATEMRLLKHPYLQGVLARRGIEF